MIVKSAGPPRSGVARRRQPLRPTLQHPQPLGSWLGATILLVVLSLVVPLMAIDPTWGPLFRASSLLALVITVYAALRLAELYKAGRPQLVQVTFWAFVYLFMGLSSLAQATADRFPIPNQLFAEEIRVQALAGVLFGLLAFDLGRAFALTRQRTRLRRRVERPVISPRRVWILGVVAGVCTMGIVMTTGGLGTRFQSRQRADEAIFGKTPWNVQIYQLDNKTVGLVKTMLLWIPAFVAILLLLYLRKCAAARFPKTTRVRWVRGPVTSLLLVGLVIVNIVANNPIANPRIRFGGVLFSITLILLHVERPRRLRVFLVGLLVAILVVFPYADVFRYDVQQTIQITPLRGQLVDSPDYAMFQQEMNGIVYVRTHGYTFGRQTLAAMLPFVPKSVWAGQPDATGDIIARNPDINASATLWTEANVEGGWLAIGVLFLLYGMAAMLADEAYERRARGRPSLVGVAVPTFAAFQFFVLRGSLLPVVGELAPVVVLMLVCTRLLFVRRSGKPAADSQLETSVEAQGPEPDMASLSASAKARQ